MTMKMIDLGMGSRGDTAAGMAMNLDILGLMRRSLASTGHDGHDVPTKTYDPGVWTVHLDVGTYTLLLSVKA